MRRVSHVLVKLVISISLEHDCGILRLALVGFRGFIHPNEATIPYSCERDLLLDAGAEPWLVQHQDSGVHERHLVNKLSSLLQHEWEEVCIGQLVDNTAFILFRTTN